MTTEAQADRIIAVLEDISNKLSGGTTSGGGKAGRPPASGKVAAKITREMVLAALQELKEAQGAPASKRIVTKIGAAKSFDGVTADKYAAMFAEVKRLMADDGEEATEAEEEDDGL